MLINYFWTGLFCGALCVVNGTLAERESSLNKTRSFTLRVLLFLSMG